MVVKNKRKNTMSCTCETKVRVRVSNKRKAKVKAKVGQASGRAGARSITRTSPVVRTSAGRVKVKLRPARKSKKESSLFGFAGGSDRRIQNLRAALSYYKSAGKTGYAGMIQRAIDAEMTGEDTSRWALPQEHIQAMFASTMHGTRMTGYARGRKQTRVKSVCRTRTGKFKKCA
jgi:hypothetical protein